MEYEFLCKTFRCCIEEDCDSCPLYDFEIEHCEKQIKLQALSFIILQQAEIEKLKKIDNKIDSAGAVAALMAQKERLARFKNEWEREVRAEAVREFAEKLKKWKYQSSDWSHGEHPFVVEETDIDELVIEMTEKEEAEKPSSDDDFEARDILQNILEEEKLERHIEEMLMDAIEEGADNARDT